MVEFGEIVNLVLGVAVLAYALVERSRFSHLPEWHLLLTSLVALIFSWFCTVLEGFLWGDFFQLLEHLLLASTATLLATWSWRAFIRQRDERSP